VIGTAPVFIGWYSSSSNSRPCPDRSIRSCLSHRWFESGPDPLSSPLSLRFQVSYGFKLSVVSNLRYKDSQSTPFCGWIRFSVGSASFRNFAWSVLANHLVNLRNSSRELLYWVQPFHLLMDRNICCFFPTTASNSTSSYLKARKVLCFISSLYNFEFYRYSRYFLGPLFFAYQ